MGRFIMRESEVLQIIRAAVAKAGDDAAILPFGETNLLLTTDMLHRTTDFPDGASPYTIGWRSVAVSLSDLAAMGARPLAVLLALGDPDLAERFIRGVLAGARACCAAAGTDLVGGDIDQHSELTVVGSALGEAANPVRRSGAGAGDLVCVTGELGSTQTALRLFATGAHERANALFCFSPRVEWGESLAPFATSMVDISDGLAHSLHLLARESRVGCSIEEALLPVIPDLVQTIPQEARSDAILFGGEDYELLFTLPEADLKMVSPIVSFRVIGRVVCSGVRLDGQDLPDQGWEHGG
ncbi:thiamine-phosphate kinase [Candidatus Bipolaricaulota bacterium]|nr:thiamine-phosphate kinase [Candidatus Bipolaricaulota bacterium]